MADATGGSSQRPVVLVTGAGRGIGAAVGRLAAGRGWAVAYHYRASGDRARQLAADTDGVAVHADLADGAAIAAMFAAVDRHFGRLDALVNNAATVAGYGPHPRFEAGPINAMLAVNVTAPLLCCRQAAARLPAGGSIVNISSKAAVLGGAGEWVDYAATKGAIDTLTRGLALELAPQGIRVNAVRPGLIDTDFHDHAPPGRMDQMAPHIPLGRAGTALEVAEAVLWLMSPESAYVTGTIVDVTGGR